MFRRYIDRMKTVIRFIGHESFSPRLALRFLTPVHAMTASIFLFAASSILVSICAAADDTAQTAGQAFSFAVTADPRAEGPSWRNALREIRDMTVNPEPAFSPPSWVVLAGDMDPARMRFADYTSVFSDPLSRPPLVPVVGNHDTGLGDFTFIRDFMIPAVPGAVRREPDSCDYYFDFRNVRMIVVDAFTKSGKEGVIYDSGRRWVEGVIRSTPASIEHVFLTFHEPAFPRGHHVTDSFNADPGQRNAFWRMLLSSGRVRAVFVGHTHFYSRMRVRDPESTAANNIAVFPNDEGGIYQVDAGAAGHGITNTFVRVQVDGKRVSIRAYAAATGDGKPFAEFDRWQLPDSDGGEKTK